MRHEIIHRAPEGYCSFPGLAVLADGTLLCVFRAAGRRTYEEALRGEHTHQDPDSRILLSAKSPGAANWSAPRVVFEGGEMSPSDPAITILADGAWLIRFARWRLVGSNERDKLGGELMRHYLRRGLIGTMKANGYMVSTDRGQSWREVEATVADKDWGTATSREAVLELADGSWALPVYAGYPFAVECAALLRSFDRGRNWGDASLIAGNPAQRLPYRSDVSHNETCVAMLDDMMMVALIRADSAFVSEGAFISEGGVGELRWSVSTDAGLTWDEPRSTGLWGQPGHILVLAGGDLVCTYGHRRKPFGVQAALCQIENGAFKVRRHIVLRDDAAGWDCGYPSSVRTAAGDIVSAYYLHGPDGVRHIAATAWRIDEMQTV
jgi:sialidase-1